MNSFETIKAEVLATIANATITNKIYVVSDVHARFSVYILGPVTDDYLAILKERTSGLVERIEIISEDGFIYKDLNHPDYLPPLVISQNVFLVDRHIGLQNWQVKSRFQINTPIICFYSFKGGLGRTTSLVLTAMQLARQGKRIALLDFDLEAPGLSTLFTNDFPDIERFKGVTDYLVDLMTLKYDESKIDLNEYYYNINRQDVVGNRGGELKIFPAGILDSDENLYLSKFSKVNYIFQAGQRKSPIDLFLTRIEAELKPDFILIDTRTGLNDLGGIFLTRYAEKSFLFFYGNRQNMFGLETLLPQLKAQNLKFFLINSPVPPQPLAQDERSYFLERSYSLFSSLYYNTDKTPYINDETAPHYPIEIPFNNLAVLLDNAEKLKSLLDENNSGNAYELLASIIAPAKKEFEEKKDSASSEQPEQALLSGFESIAPDGSAAGEYEFTSYNDLKTKFYPRRDYKFIFDRSKYLILGEKGAGKTALYAVLSNKEYAVELAKFCDTNDGEIQNTTWIKGLDLKESYPNQSVFEYLESYDDKTYRNFWKLLLLNHLDESMKSGDKIDWIVFVDNAKSSISLKLDQEIESKCLELESKDKYITVIYDYLDVLIREENNIRGRILSALLDVWRNIQTRQSRLCTKIFIRNDIFEREINYLTDKVKLNNHSAEISWEYDQLLNIAWKRLYHSSAAVVTWLTQFIEKKSLVSEALGIIPELKEQDHKKLLELLLGEYMGGNNKAFPYNWILYHISDTKRQIQPRSLLNLFSEAARRQLNEQQLLWDEVTPLKPKSMEMAMDKVSQYRVQDIKEEYPTLKPVFDNLRNYHQQFPIDESDLEKSLQKLIDESELSISVAEIKRKLEDIGVLYEYKFTLKNKEKRFHIPDLYLIGMGLTRKGPGAHKALFGKK